MLLAELLQKVGGTYPMIQRFYPGIWEESTYVIPFEEYAKKGIKGVIFDIDNTLVPHGAPADERAVALFERIHGMGLETGLLSYKMEPRVKPFAIQVNSPYLYRGGKPKRGGYERAMELMGTDAGSTIFVGDQLFTDVYGANRAGIYSILVRPIDPREEIQIVLKRFLEKPVLWFYSRQKRGKQE